MIFYRSDVTQPSKVFSEGFKPRYSLEKILLKSSNWLNLALRPPNADRVVCDASPYVVSLTYKFESAAIFPVNVNAHSQRERNCEQEIYIYAISLPDHAIPDTTSAIEPNIAYDLYSKQVKDLAKILSDDCCGLTYNTGYKAFMLAAYEAFAHEISAENIMYAIKCTRSDLLPKKSNLVIYPEDTYYHANIDRTFVIDNVIFENPRFNPLFSAQMSYDKNIAFKKYRDVACKLLHTTTVSEALAGKIFALPKTETLGDFYYSHKSIEDYWYLLFVSILLTVYTTFSLACKKTKLVIFNKNNEIVMLKPPIDLIAEQTTKLLPKESTKSMLSKAPLIRFSIST